jgi:hypothetical protein
MDSRSCRLGDRMEHYSLEVAALPESASGPKRTCHFALPMSAFWGIADVYPLPSTSPVAPHGENKSRQRYRNNQRPFKIAVAVAVRNY